MVLSDAASQVVKREVLERSTAELAAARAAADDARYELARHLNTVREGRGVMVGRRFHGHWQTLILYGVHRPSVRLADIW